MLPSPLDHARRPVTHVCPDCGGAKSVRAEGRGRYLLFDCQVGHAYSATSLLCSKEERLEQALWSTVYLVEEMANLLADLAGRGGPDGREPNWPAASSRIERLHEDARRLRAILEVNERLDLGDATALQRDGA